MPANLITLYLMHLVETLDEMVKQAAILVPFLPFQILCTPQTMAAISPQGQENA